MSEPRTAEQVIAEVERNQVVSESQLWEIARDLTRRVRELEEAEKARWEREKVENGL